MSRPFRTPDLTTPVAQDAVNHPAHYNSHPSGVEVIVITEHLNFCVGNAVKYLLRGGHKGGPADHLQDLKKARWYVDREIARLENAPLPGGRKT